MSNTKQNTQSYTWDLVNSMMQGQVASKEAHGMRMLSNGLVEDCTGNLLAFGIEQGSKVLDEDCTIHTIKITLKPTNIINF